MKEIVAELKARDKRLAQVIDLYPLCTIGDGRKKPSNFHALVESVVSQQLATKAADTIFARLKEAARGDISQGALANLSEADFRAAGISGAKTKTIQGLISSEIDFGKLHRSSDEEIRTSLTSLWGIGPWTVDMFMIFQLDRLDIWPVGDLGVRRGWEKIYKLKEEITPAQLMKKGAKFAPYRSVVAWYCWRALTPA